jgi:hypothetical protein
MGVERLLISLLRIFYNEVEKLFSISIPEQSFQVPENLPSSPSQGCFIVFFHGFVLLVFVLFRMGVWLSFLDSCSLQLGPSMLMMTA